MEIIKIKSKFLKNIFDQNTYICIGKNSAIIIDAGGEVKDIEKHLDGKKVLAVLMTHLHFDHLWNIEEYVKRFDCDVYMCKGAEEKLTDPNANASFMIRKDMLFNIPKNKIKYYAEKLKIGEFEVEVFFTPGHTDDGVCLKIDSNLFTGDTVFNDNIGRCDLEGGSTSLMRESLKNILSIDFKKAYPGHFNEASKEEISNTIKYYI